MGSERGYNNNIKQRKSLPIPVKPPRAKSLLKSRNNAYILLLGLSDSGKSTTLNHIFGDREISPTERGTGTLEVLEFGAKSLRIIDTPGLGSGNGVEWDARVLATIDTFVAKHEELITRIPNIVMIFSRFDDNRTQGETSNFVKMLKTLNLRREKFLDTQSNNLIIVLTHAMNEKKAIRQNPAPRLELIQNIIKSNTRFPHPPIIILAENEADDFDLPKSLDESYSILPDGSKYPQNIVEAILNISRTSADFNGIEIFEEILAYETRQNINLELLSTTKLLEKSQSAEVFSQLVNVHLNSTSTEMLEELAMEWNSRGRSCLEPIYLDFLNMLDKKNYTDYHKVPETPPEIIKLLVNFKSDEDLVGIMERVMKLDFPSVNDLSGNRNVGFGYYTITDNFLSKSCIEFMNFKVSPILGYKLPDEIYCKLLDRTGTPVESIFFHFVANQWEYCELRAKHMQLKSQILVASGMKSGYNILRIPRAHKAGVKRSVKIKSKMHSNSLPNTKADLTKSVTLIKEFRFGKIFYKNARTKHNLDPDFVTAVRQLQPFVRSRMAMKQWRTFFSTYGTHVVKSAFFGGAILIQLDKLKFEALLLGAASNSGGSNSQIGRDVIKIQDGIFTEIFEPQKRFMGSAADFEFPPDLVLRVDFIGGNVCGSSVEDVLELPALARMEFLEEWKMSLKESPVILERALELTEMKEFVEQCCLNVGNRKMEEVFNSYDDAFDALFVSLPRQSKNKNCNLL